MWDTLPSNFQILIHLRLLVDDMVILFLYSLSRLESIVIENIVKVIVVKTSRVKKVLLQGSFSQFTSSRVSLRNFNLTSQERSGNFLIISNPRKKVQGVALHICPQLPNHIHQTR